MKTIFNILVLTFLLVAASSPCFAEMTIEQVSKERAKELGMEIRTKANGTNSVWVELEFKPEGKLKDFSHVSLEIREEKQLLVGYAALREKRSSSGSVVVSFMANRAFLDKMTLRVVVADVPLGGSGYELRVRDFAEPSAPSRFWAQVRSGEVRNFMVHGLKVGVRLDDYWPVAANVYVPAARLEDAKQGSAKLQPIIAARLAGLKKDDITQRDRCARLEDDILADARSRLPELSVQKGVAIAGHTMTAQQFDVPSRRERGWAAGGVGVFGALPPVGYLDRATWRETGSARCGARPRAVAEADEELRHLLHVMARR